MDSTENQRELKPIHINRFYLDISKKSEQGI
jgi:hypothetical protein